ncbi:MAG: carboxylesterase, partial [Woeseiaceae bacterium]
MTETVEVETGPDPVGSVIWLHGLGADGHDFEPVVGQLGLPESMPLMFVFPHAPVRPVTINGGTEMRAWYDIRSFDAEGRADHEGVRDSSRILDALIDREIDRGIPADRIVVAGFSQGGAIAVHNVLR